MSEAYDKVKSSWDWYCRQAADEIGSALRASGVLKDDLTFVDIDDVVSAEAAMKSDKPLAGWGVEGVTPAPREPLYCAYLRFAIRVPADASNTVQAKLVAAFSGKFRHGTYVTIRNYLDQASIDADERFGRMMFVQCDVGSAASDSNASVREVRVEARVSCR